MATPPPLPISGISHLSLRCSSVEKSVAFYERVLGFVPIKRPEALDCEGAWLFNHGLGIHLIQTPHVQPPTEKEIDPKDDHMSFESACQDVTEIEDLLQELAVRHKRVQVEEGGILVDQIFFHDPDGNMIEVCTCDNLPVEPLKSPPQSLSVCHGTTSTSFGCGQQQYAGCRTSSATLQRATSMTEIQETL